MDDLEQGIGIGQRGWLRRGQDHEPRRLDARRPHRALSSPGPPSMKTAS